VSSQKRKQAEDVLTFDKTLIAGGPIHFSVLTLVVADQVWMLEKSDWLN